MCRCWIWSTASFFGLVWSQRDDHHHDGCSRWRKRIISSRWSQATLSQWLNPNHTHSPWSAWEPLKFLLAITCNGTVITRVKQQVLRNNFHSSFILIWTAKLPNLSSLSHLTFPFLQSRVHFKNRSIFEWPLFGMSRLCSMDFFQQVKILPFLSDII